MLKEKNVNQIPNDFEENNQNESIHEEQSMNCIKRETQSPYLKNCTCHILEAFKSPNHKGNRKSKVMAPRPIKPCSKIFRATNNTSQILHNVNKNNKIYQDNASRKRYNVFQDNSLNKQKNYSEFIKLITEKITQGDQFPIKHKINKLVKLNSKNIPEEEQDLGNFISKFEIIVKKNKTPICLESSVKKVNEFVADSRVSIVKSLTKKRLSHLKGKRKVSKHEEKEIFSHRNTVALEEPKIVILTPKKEQIKEEIIPPSVDLICNQKLSDKNCNTVRVHENEDLIKGNDKSIGNLTQYRSQNYEKDINHFLKEEIAKHHDLVKMQNMKKILNQTVTQYYSHNLAINFTYSYPFYQYFPMPSPFIPMYIHSVNSPASSEFKMNLNKISNNENSKRKLKIESSINNSISINPQNDNLDINFNSLALNNFKFDTISQATIERSPFKNLGRDSVGRLIDTSKVFEDSLQQIYFNKNNSKMQKTINNFNKKSSLILIDNEEEYKAKNSSRILELKSKKINSGKLDRNRNAQLSKNESNEENKILNISNDSNLIACKKRVPEPPQLVDSVNDDQQNNDIGNKDSLNEKDKKVPDYISKIKKGIIKKRSINEIHKKDILKDRIKEANQINLSKEKIKEIDNKLSKIVHLNTHSKVIFTSIIY